MDRYLLAELIPLFLFSFGLFSSLGVAVGTLSDLANHVFDSGVPINIALQVLLLKLPEFAAYAFPIAILLTTLITYGRLSRDSELVALRSCGVSLYRLVIPALILSLGVTALSYGFNEVVVPPANYQARLRLEQALPADRVTITSDPIIFPEFTTRPASANTSHQPLKRLFYAKQLQGDRLQEVTVIRWQDSQLVQIVIAQSAWWNPEQHHWELSNGIAYPLASDASYQAAQPFTTRSIRLSRGPLDLARHRREPHEMNLAQAREYTQLLALSQNEKQLRYLQVRIQQKLAFPFVCLIFGLMGSTLGAGPHQAARTTSFGISVGIVFIYYLLGFTIGSLGLVGVLSPFMAAWLPNFLGLGIGSWLLYKAAS